MSFPPVLRGFVVALVVLGLMSGTMAYAMPGPMVQMAMTTGEGQGVAVPCDMMSAMQGTDGQTSEGKMPCNTITPDCVKKMACPQTVALPERPDLSVGSVAFAKVTYLVGTTLPAGLTPKPELS